MAEKLIPFQVRVPASVHQRMSEAAERHYRTLNGEARAAFEQYLSCLEKSGRVAESKSTYEPS